MSLKFLADMGISPASVANLRATGTDWTDTSMNSVQVDADFQGGKRRERTRHPFLTDFTYQAVNS